MARGIKRKIKLARDRAQREIKDNAKGGKYAAGLAAEGRAGGYIQALDDVLLALNGGSNHDSPYWPGA